MADRSWARDRASLARGVIEDVGYVDIAADASVSTSNHPLGTFTKTGTGEYTLTLADKYKSFLGVNCQLRAATPVDLVPQVKSETAGSSTNTVVVNLNAGATPTNPAAVCRLYVRVALKNTDVTP